MVEVYSTDVKHENEADFLAIHIGQQFPTYHVNFDLEDCDRILRVACEDGIEVDRIIVLLHDFGFAAKVLNEITAEEQNMRLADFTLQSD